MGKSLAQHETASYGWQDWLRYFHSFAKLMKIHFMYTELILIKD